jgi:ATP-dependent Clp protease adaptor protein ClpS
MPGVKIAEEEQTKQKNSPRWNVILLDDPNHTFAYVTDLITNVFRRSLDDAKDLTEEVHRMGRAKERAELYLEQVRSYGNDPFMKMFGKKESGPLGVTMEPADD